MKSLAIALVGCGLWAMSPLAQSTPAKWSAEIPQLSAPEGAATHGRGGSGLGLQVGAGLLPSASFHTRLLTDLTADTLADHYLAQLVASGWKLDFKQADALLANARFSAGTPTDPLTGMLVVVPFGAARQTLVAVRLIVNRWAWTGRTGGAGAAPPRAQTLKFASQLLELPLSVTRAVFAGAGGTSNYMLHEARLECGDSPAALMPHFEVQLPKKGWTTVARIRDGSQHTVRRDSMPDPETDSSEIWMVTRMPGGREIDVAFMTVQTWRGRK